MRWKRHRADGLRMILYAYRLKRLRHSWRHGVVFYRHPFAVSWLFAYVKESTSVIYYRIAP